MQHQAFVKLHLAGTLAVSRIRPGISLSEHPDATEALEMAVGIEGVVPDSKADGELARLKLFEKNLFAFSSVVVCGVTQIELARWRFEQEKYEDALFLMNDGANDLFRASFEIPPQSGVVTSRYETLLPHSGQEFSVEEIQYAVNMFEKLRKNPTRVTGAETWPKIHDACESMAGTAMDVDPDQVVNDDDGRMWVANTYWERAAVFADSRMSQDQLLNLWEKKQRTDADERLRRDFFDDAWENLPLKVRESLIDAETQWYSKPRPSYDHMMTAYRKAVEQLLKAHFPFLAEKTKRKLDRNSIPWLPPDIGTLPTTFLGKMHIILEYDPAVKNWIQKVLSREADSSFLLISLPEHLKDLTGVRNYYEHEDNYPDKAEKDIVEQAKKVRCKLLGIRYGESVIRRLVEIRRGIDQEAVSQSRHTP